MYWYWSLIQLAILGKAIRDDSFIPQSENIGRENQVNVVEGEAPNKKSSGDPEDCLLVTFKILLRHQ